MTAVATRAKTRSTGRPHAAVAALCLVQAVDVLGVTVLIAALPAMLRSLGAPASMAGLLATSYAMAFGGLLMLGARLGDRFGPRRVLLAGLLAFAGASAIAGAAPSLTVLVLARCLQGAAAAASVPTALALLSEVTSGEAARRRAMAAWSAAGAAAGASGLLAGGLLTSLVGWRSIFWLNLPLAALLILAVLRTAPSSGRRSRATLDWVGGLLLTFGLMSLILAASLLEHAASRFLGGLLGAVGCLILALFAHHQRTVRTPLLPRRALGERRLRIGAGAAFVNTATTSSAITLATLYLQNARHLNPATAGLMLLPFSLCVVVGAGLAGRSLQYRDPALSMAIGFGLIAVGDGALLLPGFEVLMPVCAGASGLGIGLSSVAANTVGTDVREEHRGAAAGILNTSAQVGTALGVAVAVLIATATDRSGLPLRGPFLSWALAALLAAGAALRALRRLRYEGSDAGSRRAADSHAGSPPTRSATSA